MKTLRLFIPGNFLDAYIYSGYLFAISADGTIRALPMAMLAAHFMRHRRKMAWLYHLAFTRNDWFTNQQARTMYWMPEFRHRLGAAWEIASRKTETVLLNPEEWTFVCELKDANVQDFRLYGMKLFVGCRSGVYETGIESHELRGLKVHSQLNRFFDGKVTSLSAKGGQVLISAGTDGLHHARVGHPLEAVQYEGGVLAKTSYRTGWYAYDLLNYLSRSRFEYLENEVVKERERTVLYSRIDESSEKVRITKLAVKSTSSEHLLEGTELAEASVIFSFNSSGRVYSVLANGDVKWTRITRERDNTTGIKDRFRGMANVTRTIKRRGHPISAHAAGDSAWVVEFFDQVSIIAEGSLHSLIDEPAISVRTFPSAKRFRRLVLITTEKGLLIHCLPPKFEPFG